MQTSLGLVQTSLGLVQTSLGLVQTTLGLSVNAARRSVVFNRTTLPIYLQEVELRNVRIQEGTIDLVLERHEEHVGVEVLRRAEDIEVMVLT